MIEIVLASNNANKAREITDILGSRQAVVLTLPDVGFIGEIEETGETLAENALIKARVVSKRVASKIIIADDTGLEVDYLAKAPGVYSARFAGPECSYTDNNLKLLIKSSAAQYSGQWWPLFIRTKKRNCMKEGFQAQ